MIAVQGVHIRAAADILTPHDTPHTSIYIICTV